MRTIATPRGRPLLNSIGASLLMTLCVACGGGSGGDSISATPPVSTAPPVTTVPPVSTPALSILAGSPSESGLVDGSGSAARFDRPAGMAIDTAGNLYVGADCAIRRITPAGVVSLYAGAYCVPLSSSTPDSFPSAFTLASAADGRLFMTTYGLNIYEVSPAGAARKIIALEEANGGGRGAAIAYGNGIAADAAGNLVVTNGFGARRVSPSGSYTMLDGVATAPAGFNTYIPERRGVAVDAAGTVYLAKTDGTILRIDGAGKATVLAGTQNIHGASDGTGAAASFTNVVALALDGQGNLYAADSGSMYDSNNVLKYNALIRKITPAGVVTTIAGTPGVQALQPGALPGGLAPLAGIALDGKGNLYAISGVAIVKIVLP